MSDVLINHVMYSCQEYIMNDERSHFFDRSLTSLV